MPDPTNSIYTVTGILEDYNINIIDATGSVYESIDSSDNAHSIDLSHLPVGTFLIRVSDPNDSQLCVEKIIKY